MRISSRGAVDPFIVMEVLRAAEAQEAAGGDVIHMEIGQPGTPAPHLARAAAARAMEAGPLGYTGALGIEPLRRRIARWHRDRYGLEIDSARIAVTDGASGAFVLALLALFDTGDRVALAEPGYPAYRNMLRALDLRPAPIVTGPQTRFQPDPAGFAAVMDAAGLIVASPSNPCGAVLTRDEMAALSAATRAAGAALISDEIYHGLEYGPRATCALEVDDEALVIGSFSKYWSMTGWRVGWLIVPPALVETVERLAQNLFICAPHISQAAALGAMEADDELQQNVAVYARNREILLEALPKAGFTRLSPCEGAFYFWADVSELTDDSVAFCRRMLAEAGVAATPGVDFDPARGGRFLRFSFAGPTERMIEGAERLHRWMSKTPAR